MVIIRITENEEAICLKDIPAEAKLGAEISSFRREESRTKQMIHGAVFPREVLSIESDITHVQKNPSGNHEAAAHRSVPHNRTFRGVKVGWPQ